MIRDTIKLYKTANISLIEAWQVVRWYRRNKNRRWSAR